MVSIKKKDILDWYNYMIEKGQTASNVNVCRTTLHALFEYGIDWYDFESNPVAAVKRMKDSTPNEPMLFFDLDEFTDFIKCVDNPKYNRLFSFLYYTGCRKGEARAFTWKDIDFKNNILTVSKSMSNKRNKLGDYVINKPKNGKSRTLIMNRVLRDQLYDYYKERTNNFDFKVDEFIFGVNDALASETIRRNLINYCSKAKVKQIRVHDFRHSNASLLINAGANVVVVSERLGHKDRKQTLDRYAHIFPSAQSELMNTINFQTGVYNQLEGNTIAPIVIDFINKINKLNIDKLSDQEQEFIIKFKKLI